jgi:anti-sigma B factor antagonist
VPLSLERRLIGDIMVVKCNGRIVEGAESAALQQELVAALTDHRFIVLHLEQVDFVDSSGLGLLVRFLSRARAAHGGLKLCAVPDRIREVLRITRLQDIFDAHASEGEAIAAFYARAKSADGQARLDSQVLCVEKSPDVLAYVSGMLRQAGYGVLSSASLPDALMLLRASPPRVVVIGAALRAARDTRAAEVFNEMANGLSVIELPEGFASSDAGAAGQRLLEQVRSALGERSAAS